MTATDKPKAGLRERLRVKRREHQQRKAEQIDRARREGVTRPEDVRRVSGLPA